MMRLWAVATLCVVVLLGAAPPLAADTYPERAVHWIVPYPPGSGTDIVARLLGERLADALGKPVVVDNKPGAGGAIGVEALSKAAPDGYTIGMADTGPLAINPALYPKLGYDPVKSFAPISNIALLPFLLVVNPSLPVKTTAELIAYAKAHPGQVNYASVGNGSSVHLATELFKKMAGIDMVHIPYKGSAPALQDLLGGQVSVMFVNLLSSQAYLKDGSLRALAVAPAKRLSALPDLPTVAESGVPGYDFVTWFGVLAPAGTPEPIVTRLNTEIVRILKQPDIRQRLIEQGGLEPVGSTPEEFRKLIAGELSRVAEIVKSTGAHID
jgi:tripartite-type tricarboxylate transporter receptor subunit TctC